MVSSPSGSPAPLDVIVVGAGFAGLYMLQRLRQLGLSARVIEAAPDVGGTWYWNRYPGARCDVASVEYCYSFSPEIDEAWNWSERFATQPEILRYIRFAADRLDLRRDITFGTRVLSATYEEAGHAWTVTTDRGEAITARYCVMATGNLSVPVLPDIAGIGDFGGTILHTAAWPEAGADLTGKRVGVIGTGSSGCQLIPEIAPLAGELVVFQRTANHCLPAGNQPMEERYYRRIKGKYADIRKKWRASPLGTSMPAGSRSALDVTDAERTATYQHHWEIGGASLVTAFDDIFVDAEANRTAADFVADKIRTIVADPDVAEQLVPADHPIGSKRVALVSSFYETFNRDNVRLVSAGRAPIERIAPDGVVAGGENIPLDVLVFATGFDAITGALLAIDIRGRDGVALRELWRDGPVAYLGVAIAGLPNLFIVTGPGSPSVLSNVVSSIEQHVEWIGDCLAWLGAHDVTEIDADADMQAAWMDHTDQVAQLTLFPKAKSWYSGDNVAGKPHRFAPYVGGLANYAAKIGQVAADGYAGFNLSPAPVETDADGSTLVTSEHA